MAQNKNNPLKFSVLKNHAVPFTQIEPEMFLPNLRESIEHAKSQLTLIRNNPDPAQFENTIRALEMAGEDIDLISAIFFNQLNANTSEAMQKLAPEISQMLANYSSDILLDEKLFRRIETVYNEKTKYTHTQEELQLLDKYYSNFTRNGARLSADKKEELRKIDAELSKLSPQFSENVLKATNQFQMVLTQPEEIAGLPQSCLDAAHAAAEAKGLGKKDGSKAYLFTLHAPSFLPFMLYGQHRPSREKLYRAYNTRSTTGEFDNHNLIMKIVELRERRAQLLDYKHHAAFTLEKRMAESSEKVDAFLTRIREASLAAAKKDAKQVQDFAIKNGAPKDFMPWDFAFWAERLKEHLFQFNSEDLRPYFKLDNVIAGVFEHARRLYGLVFKETAEYPVYHPDVKAFEVFDETSNEFVGLFYADFFPRENKNGGAWMTNYFEQGYFHGSVQRPHVAIVCNFTQPTKDKPSLLTLDEVETLFHEFGHSLHSLLSKCHYRTLSGTNVYWDFVELPSQIMENWVQEKESLHLFAKHYQTGELIPDELAEKIKKSALYMAGYSSLRQVTFAMLDMAWHTTQFSSITSVDQFEDNIVAPLRVLPKVEGTNSSCAFTHVFAGGYSAGYYSYKWAEVLEADAFELFQENGIFDFQTAKKFKENILSRGGSEHPMELYKKFRGREPDPDALLRRDGLI